MILRQLLKPAIVFALRRGFKSQELLEALKNCLVQVAGEELTRLGEDPNQSKLAAMTGLPRREVSKRMDLPDTQTEKLNVISKIIGQWQHDKRFLTERGKPASLHHEGAESEFSELVQSVTSDLNPYTVLFEMHRLNLVTKEDNTIQLNRKTFESKPESNESYEFWSRDIALLSETLLNNIQSEECEAPQLHINTTYDNIVTEKLPEIQEWILKRGAAFHAELRTYLSKFDKDLNPTLYASKGQGKVSVCSFSLTNEKKDS